MYCLTVGASEARDALDVVRRLEHMQRTSYTWQILPLANLEHQVGRPFEGHKTSNLIHLRWSAGEFVVKGTSGAARAFKGWVPLSEWDPSRTHLRSFLRRYAPPDRVFSEVLSNALTVTKVGNVTTASVSPRSAGLFLVGNYTFTEVDVLSATGTVKFVTTSNSVARITSEFSVIYREPVQGSKLRWETNSMSIAQHVEFSKIGLTTIERTPEIEQALQEDAVRLRDVR